MKEIFKAMIVSMGIVSCSLAISADEPPKPIARVYDSFIYEKDLEVPLKLLQENRQKLSKESYENWEKEYKLNLLEGLMWRSLSDHFLSEQGIKPIQDEIEAFVSFLKVQDSVQLDKFQKERREILEKLKAPNLKEGEKNSLSKQLEIFDTAIQQELEIKEENKKIPNYDQIQEKSWRNIASITITEWKFNKALYEKYGGRVIFQQAGLEPIDAYKQFLMAQRNKKTYEILDSSFIHVFGGLEKYFEMEHTYVEEKDAMDYFLNPWWKSSIKK